ncbi:MAG: hypothetical protein KKA07_01790, partial [Bacteroidetes bacterium]|nr:hypothetical protein [Bacteroidota bacterium]
MDCRFCGEGAVRVIFIAIGLYVLRRMRSAQLLNNKPFCVQPNGVVIEEHQYIHNKQLIILFLTVQITDLFIG